MYDIIYFFEGVIIFRRTTYLSVIIAYQYDVTFLRLYDSGVQDIMYKRR